jgi:cell division protein ZapD
MSSYEFPFNERIRTLLRIEDLFNKALANVESEQQTHHHSALMYMLQIMDIIDRIDVKVDLVQELDKQRLAMHNLRGNPNISEKTLNSTIKQIESCAAALRLDATRVGQSLRENEWLMSIRQRAAIPGGVCQFDLPSYHHWLNLNHERRRADLDKWLENLMPMRNAMSTVLHILRGSGNATKLTAKNGFYQQMLGGSKPAQMLRIEVPDNCPCFPEVSANKYAISVRFNGIDFVQKPKQCDHDIDFKMTLCNL